MRKWTNKNSHSLLVRILIWWFIIKLHIFLTYNPVIFFPWYLSKEVENTSTQNMHMVIYSYFISDCQNLEATKIPFSTRMDKLWHIQVMEYYSVLKSNELLSHKKTKGTFSARCQVQEFSWKGYKLCDSKNMTFWKRQN